jgi:hypothetical protein
VLTNEIIDAAKGKHNIYKPSGLEPESIKDPAERKDERLYASKDGFEPLVFLYNGLDGIFDCRDPWHFAYCSPKRGVS